MNLKLVNWNLQWAVARKSNGKELLRRIKKERPDVVCLTESRIGFLANQGPSESIFSTADYGYGMDDEKRKVALWSNASWKKSNDFAKEKDLPPGRFISGLTQTPIGEIQFIGVCIPWDGSRVKGSDVKRRKWEDHELFLDELDRILPKKMPKRTIIVGDFNQRFPKSKNSPPKLYAKLLDLLVRRKMVVVTTGFGFEGKRTIDHVVVSQDLVAESVRVLSNLNDDTVLSDHVGVAVEISTKVD